MVVIERVVVDDNVQTVSVLVQVVEHGTVDHDPYTPDHLVVDIVALLKVLAVVDPEVKVYHLNRRNRCRCPRPGVDRRA